MIPAFEDRMDSIIRALEDVIFPSLPESAGLAREQTGLAIAHLRIMRSQLDGEALLAAEELAGTRAFAEAVCDMTGGASVEKSLQALHRALAAEFDRFSIAEVRKIRATLNSCICSVISAVLEDGDETTQARLMAIVLQNEGERSRMDGEALRPFGFN